MPNLKMVVSTTTTTGMEIDNPALDYLATLVEGAPGRGLLQGIRALFGVSSENGPLAFR